MKEDDFALPDFKIHVKLNDQSSTELIKETLEFSNSVLETDRKVKNLAPTKIDDLSGQVGYIKNFSKKINLKSHTHAYENFFLYDLENMIKPTFVTELKKEFSIYLRNKKRQ